MAESETRPPSATPPFELRLSGDRRFHRIVGELYARAAEQVGYGAVDALEIGRSIERAVLGIMEHGFPDHACEHIAIRFAINAHVMNVILRYHAGAGEPAPVAAVEVERALAAPRDGEVPLDVIRHAMPEIEFGRDGDIEYCRLSRKLPGTA